MVATTHSAAPAAVGLFPALTPQGRLRLEPSPDAPPLPEDVASRLVEAFERGDGAGLLHLGAAEVGSALPPVLVYWRELGSAFVTALCTMPGAAGDAAKLAPPAPPRTELMALAAAAPPMTGAEYLTGEVLEALWRQMGRALRAELGRSRLSLEEQLKRWSPAWNLVGRVHFHLAENRRDEEAPFAFLATYTPRLSGHGKAQHLPLGEALREYAGAARREALLSLLLPVQRAAAQCAWLRALVDSGEIFHPLRWTAARGLRAAAGRAAARVRRAWSCACRDGWRHGRPPRPQVTATVGSEAAVGLGTEALLDFHVRA